MKLSNWVLLITLSLIWGFSFLFIKIGVQGFTPIWVTGIRTLLGALFLLLVLGVAGTPVPERRFWPALLVAGSLNNIIPWLLLTWAEIYITSGVASILNATTPLFSILIASQWGDETLDSGRLVGLLVGFAGVILLFNRDFALSTQVAYLPELAVLGMSLLYAVGASFVRRYLRPLAPRQVAAGQLFASVLLILPFMVFDGLPITPLPLNVIGAVAALGVLGTGLAYLFFFQLLREVGATRTLVVTLLVPISAVFWGWALLNEPVGVQTIVSMVVILTGVLLVNNQSLHRLLIRPGRLRQ